MQNIQEIILPSQLKIKHIIDMKFIYLIFILVFFWACNNNLTEIGQDMIDNESFVQVVKYDLTNTSTIKLDSFPTSSPYSNSDYAVTQLLMGRYNDRFSGTTVATAYFQVAPASRPSIDQGVGLDSLTLRFSSAGRIWGDTLSPKLQTFRLHQLKKLPITNDDDDKYFYSNHTEPYEDTPLSTMQFLATLSTMEKAYFKLNQQFGEQLFLRMQNRDIIFDPAERWDFLKFFKGLVIVPDEANNCLFNISATSEKLYLRFHYHQSETEKYVDFPLTQTELQFNNFKTELPPNLAGLTDQQASVPFETAGNIAISQGINGYMIKLYLPYPPSMEKYTTLIKAELELEPELIKNSNVSDPANVIVYQTNPRNDLLGMLYNDTAGKNPVVGKRQINPLNPDDDKYIFDVTDFYQRLSEATTTENTYEVLLSIPNYNLSFDRLIVNEVPKLRIYYATYNK